MAERRSTLGPQHQDSRRARITASTPVGSGDYLELEAELRGMLHALQAARSTAPRRATSGARAGVSLSASALGALESLTDAESGFALDEGAAAYSQSRADHRVLCPSTADVLRWTSR